MDEYRPLGKHVYNSFILGIIYESDQRTRSALAYLSFFGSLRSSVEPDRWRSFR